MGRGRGGGLALALLIVLSGCLGQPSAGTSAQVSVVVKREELGGLPNLTIDLRDKSLLTATSKGVYRSTDSGQTWHVWLSP
ncbi:MAG: hypothetical protein KIT87_10200 [Anaerolineae bacterium]|nr:hypothetical protein [Anaerolineae bacterium]